MKYIYFCLFILIGLVGNSQDIIILKSGEEIQSKVEEVNPTEIKYKEFQNLSGPTRSVLKADVFMIKYENGVKDVFSSSPDQKTTEIKPILETAPPQDVVLGPRPVNLSGPRIGVTFITPGQIANDLEDIFDAKPIVTQFGWQFETRFFTLPDGFSGVFEIVPLIAGLEQGLFLPSISGIIGVRTGKGVEFGVGPNISLAGAALVIAAGVTYRMDYINIPVNLAVVPSPKGTRISLLVGFNYRKNP